MLKITERTSQGVKLQIWRTRYEEKALVRARRERHKMQHQYAAKAIIENKHQGAMGPSCSESGFGARAEDRLDMDSKTEQQGISLTSEDLCELKGAALEAAQQAEQQLQMRQGKKETTQYWKGMPAGTWSCRRCGTANLPGTVDCPGYIRGPDGQKWGPCRGGIAQGTWGGFLGHL